MFAGILDNRLSITVQRSPSGIQVHDYHLGAAMQDGSLCVDATVAWKQASEHKPKRDLNPQTRTRMSTSSN